MPIRVLFIQGAGEGAYAADAELADSLRRSLGSDYDLRYPAMPDEADASYAAWRPALEREIGSSDDPQVLVGHSVGGSMLLKYLSEQTAEPPVSGIFVLSAPFWGGDGWRYPGYEALVLPDDSASRLPHGAPVYLFQARDDEIVPYEHLALYTSLLPEAIQRPLGQGGHQLGEDLSAVARDIAMLAKN